MSIQRVESITYGVDDLETSKRFYDDWGLVIVEDGSTGADYELPSGQMLRLRATSDRSLPPPIQAGSTLREIVWGVDSTDSLEEIAADLDADRSVRAADGGIRTTDPTGLAIGFTTAEPLLIPTVARPDRNRNQRFALIEPVQPFRIGHVVFNVAVDKFHETSTFYLKRLNFRLTDRVREFGDFMRCAGSRDHHNQFLLQKPTGGLNHVAFEVPRIDDIIVGAKNLQDKNWTQATSLGRHVLGSNLYWYFQNPCGGLAEYFTDMDVADDDWVAREWDDNPGFFMWML